MGDGEFFQQFFEEAFLVAFGQIAALQNSANIVFDIEAAED